MRVWCGVEQREGEKGRVKGREGCSVSLKVMVIGEGTGRKIGWK